MRRRVPPKGKPFVKGQSGNPKGRPKDMPELRATCRQHVAECVQVYVDALSDPDPRIRMQAADRILERACGKPVVGDTDPVAGQVTTLQWIEVQRTLAAS